LGEIRPRAGIDLRSLPLLLPRLDRAPGDSAPPGLSRVIGRPEHFKPYARVLNCDAPAWPNSRCLKRTDPRYTSSLSARRSRSSTGGVAREIRYLEWKLDSFAPAGMLPLSFHITMVNN